MTSADPGGGGTVGTAERHDPSAALTRGSSAEEASPSPLVGGPTLDASGRVSSWPAARLQFCFERGGEVRKRENTFPQQQFFFRIITKKSTKRKEEEIDTT